MNRSELIDIVAEKFHPFTPDETKVLVETIFDEIATALAEGKKVRFNNYIHMSTKTLKPGFRRNPRTGEKVFVIGRKLVTFKPGHDMQEAVNQLLNR